MPKVAYNPETKQALKWNGKTWAPLTDEDWGNVKPARVLDEMAPGISDTERFTYKNFAANPSVALHAIQSKHPDWDVMQYGDGFNFAVRAPNETAFRLLDPEKGGWGELWRDFTDVLVGDIALPTAGTALGTAAGGIPGAAIGAGGAELARQGIGSALGLEQNIDPLQAGVVGGLTFGLAGTGALVGKGLRKVAGSVSRGLAQRAPGIKQGRVSQFIEENVGAISGIQPAKDLPISRILLDRAAMSKAGVRPRAPSEVVQVIQSHLDQVAPNAIKTAVGQRDALIPAGTTVDLFRLRKPLSELVDEALGERTVAYGDSLVRRQVQQALRAILTPPSKAEIATRLGLQNNPSAVKAAYLAAKKQWENKLKSVPAQDALHLKSWLQDYAKSRGGLAGALTQTPQATAREGSKFVGDLGRFTRALNDHIKGQLDPGVRSLDRHISHLIDATDDMKAFVGTEASNPENFIRTAFERGDNPKYRLIKKYDSLFPGLNLYRLALDSRVGLAFTKIETLPGEFGRPSVRSRVTATGLPIGTALIGGGGGALVGSIAGGPIGGAVGALSGLAGASAAFSPAAITAATPRIVDAGARLSGAAGRYAARRQSLTAAATRRGLIAPAVAQMGRESGKNVAAQDTRKRRTYYLGGS